METSVYAGKEFHIPTHFSTKNPFNFTCDETTCNKELAENIGSILQQHISSNLLLHHWNTIWNVHYFIQDLDKRKPICFPCSLDNPLPLSSIRILDMPIKFKHQNQYKIPFEIAQHYGPIIEHVAQIRHLVEQFLRKNQGQEIEDEYYCYLTIDNGSIMENTSQRNGGIHVDGFQGARINPKCKMDYSFVISSVEATRFYNLKSNTPSLQISHLDPSIHNFFNDFEKQIRSRSEDFDIWRPNPNTEIVLMDAFCLHESPIMSHSQNRTFLRMSYSIREFDRLGNTNNNLFDYSWNMVPRNIQETLI